MILSPHTAVSFVYAKYRVAVAVDVSPSMFVMNPDGSLPFDVAMVSLETALSGIADPVLDHTSSTVFSPQIFLSVLARACDVVADVAGGPHGPHGRLPWAPRFLVHSVLLTRERLPEVLATIRAGLMTLEMEMAQHAEAHRDSQHARDKDGRASGSEGGRASGSGGHAPGSVVTGSAPSSVAPFQTGHGYGYGHGFGFVHGPGPGSVSSHGTGHRPGFGHLHLPRPPRVEHTAETATIPRLIQAALFALKLLPLDACPILLLVTDGGWGPWLCAWPRGGGSSCACVRHGAAWLGGASCLRTLQRGHGAVYPGACG